MKKHKLGFEYDNKLITVSGRFYFQLASEVVALQCTQCKSVKLKDDFYDSKDNLADKRSICKECDKARKRKGYKKQPEPPKKRGRKRKPTKQELKREVIAKEIRRLYRKRGDKGLENIMICNPPLYMNAVACFRGWDKALKEILGDEVEN
ncbi:hypothetical protein ABES80_12260 [Bacillus gobiensis]|uniref:hypothetical protein n=1 Tax=Bacillus gobiensis TaxID=1441095 RepID=UPI003D2620A2